jgi:hypothetical protein
MVELTMMEQQYVCMYLESGRYFNRKVCKGSCGRSMQAISEDKRE